MIKTATATPTNDGPTIFEDLQNHVDYMANLVEENEKAIVSQLKEISLPKARQALNSLRLLNPFHADLHAEISAKLTESAFREKFLDSKSTVTLETGPTAPESGISSVHLASTPDA
eukprot:Blabericola_migrator_1__186@NODE_104_length_14270_cov_182_757446_g92_i0_p13_GENE_NODE_104_length_14270_cov_182_757446_g92_i0NODE_104_length_14270_cov_182_757446_g92_i0_p13_ORF_typecomplete_len116_score19_75F_actin_cap_B/PF01115_17/0_032F_actin_cap_B/PF01115_17/1e04DUF641/PF04859_12/0_045_NODE_104_length_14270_cov_182_757446_g92_i01054310890